MDRPRMERQRVECDRPWDGVGYSRAIRVGNVIEVAGTSATLRDGTVLHPNDVGQQTRVCLTTIVNAIEQLGGTAADVVRTRFFLTDISRWEESGAVHREFFGDVLPTSSMVEITRLLHPDLVVEIEATAILDPS